VFIALFLQVGVEKFNPCLSGEEQGSKVKGRGITRLAGA
jgi:hypothetical protein